MDNYMSDFERTFGAGADAVAIVEGFSKEFASAKPTSRRPIQTESEPHGAGDLVRLDVPFERIEAEHPAGSFGILDPEFRNGYAILEQALDGDRAPIVSIGDIASAFGPGTALKYAFHISGISYLLLLSMMLASAERAAEASMEPGLLDVTRHARRLLDAQEAWTFDKEALKQTTLGRDSKNSAKACARALVYFARVGVVEYPTLVRPVGLYATVINEAADAIGLAAYERGLDPQAAMAVERGRQVEDIVSVSPRLALKASSPDNAFGPFDRL